MARRLAASTRAAAAVVRDVEDPLHVTIGDPLESARQRDAFETACDRVNGERQTRSQLANRSDRRCRVADLRRSRKRRGRQVGESFGRLLLPQHEVPASRGSRDFAEVAPADPEQRTLGVRRLDQRVWRRLLTAIHGRPAGAKDACLLARDALEIRTQPFRVIDPERNDNRDVGVDDVYRVEPPAHADLEDDRIRLRRLEDEERRQRVELEEGERIRPERISDALERRDERGSRHRLPLRDGCARHRRRDAAR